MCCAKTASTLTSAVRAHHPALPASPRRCEGLWSDVASLADPSSVELDDGSILTLYYQKPAGVRSKCALLTTRWTLPPRPS